jgi:CubicO group peptidase (beta-lactamase class C family)
MIKICLVIVVAILLIGCNDRTEVEIEQPPEKPDTSYLQPSDQNSRVWLTASQLLQGEFSEPSPIHNSHFMAINADNELTENFTGRLLLNEAKMLGSGPDTDHRGEGYLTFPGFSTDFFTQGGYFIPVEQDIMYSSGKDSFWGIILSPGKIWSEPSDDGWYRVALPFVLTDRLRNQTHNGIATFLYQESDAKVSYFRFQIIQQTASYFQHDFWGQLSLVFENSTSTNLSEKKLLFNHYLNSIPTIEPWEKLADIASPEHVNAIVSESNGADYSAIGLQFEQSLYLQECPTKYGNFPFCSQMRHGSFSVAKSMGAGMVLMWLVQRYGEDVLQHTVTDYLEIESEHSRWSKVTIKHLVDMSTSIGELGEAPENDSFSDEYNEKTGPWTWAYTVQDKLDISNSYPHYGWEPGEVFRYRTMDTFTLAAVLDALVKRKEGSNVNIWDLYTKEVLNPIGISVLPAIHTIEEDGSRGIPLFGTGLFPTAIDTALISQLLQNKGMHNGEALLNTNATTQATGSSSMKSLPFHNENSMEDETLRYRFSFWLKKGTHLECEYWVPRMSGYGGNFIHLLPNGVSFFVYQDAFSSTYLPEAEKIADSLSPLCQ